MDRTPHISDLDPELQVVKDLDTRNAIWSLKNALRIAEGQNFPHSNNEGKRIAFEQLVLHFSPQAIQTLKIQAGDDEVAKGIIERLSQEASVLMPQVLPYYPKD